MADFDIERTVDAMVAAPSADVPRAVLFSDHLDPATGLIDWESWVAARDGATATDTVTATDAQAA